MGLAFAIDILVIWVFWRGFNRVTNNISEEFLTARSEACWLRCYKHVVAGPMNCNLAMKVVMKITVEGKGRSEDGILY